MRRGSRGPPQDQQYLFEPFFTGFDTLRHSSGDYQFGKRGIGLGSGLVKTFVELHGGRVEVQAPPNTARPSASSCRVASRSESTPGQPVN